MTTTLTTVTAEQVTAAKAALTAASEPFLHGKPGSRQQQTHAALLALTTEARTAHPTATHLELADSDQGPLVYVIDVLDDAGCSLTPDGNVGDLDLTYLYDDSRDHWTPFTDLERGRKLDRYSVDGVPGGLRVVIDRVLATLLRGVTA